MAGLRDGKWPAQAAELAHGRARAPDSGGWNIRGRLEGVLVREEGKGQCRGRDSKNEVERRGGREGLREAESIGQGLRDHTQGLDFIPEQFPYGWSCPPDEKGPRGQRPSPRAQGQVRGLNGGG